MGEETSITYIVYKVTSLPKIHLKYGMKVARIYNSCRQMKLAEGPH